MCWLIYGLWEMFYSFSPKLTVLFFLPAAFVAFKDSIALFSFDKLEYNVTSMESHTVDLSHTIPSKISAME